MIEVLTRERLSAHAAEVARKQGELVWDCDAVVGTARFSQGHSWTTLLSRSLRHNLGWAPGDPGGWAVEFKDELHWCLYLRRGESYSENGTHSFHPPVEVAVKSPDEYLEVYVPPRDQWWQAPFLCPFCEQLCVEGGFCPHLLVSHHSLAPEYRDTPFQALFRQMAIWEFNCNLINAAIDGLVIKVPCRPLGPEWFRFAYWYARDRQVATRVEDCLRRALESVAPGNSGQENRAG